MATDTQSSPDRVRRVRPGRLLGDVIVELGFCDRDTVEQAVRDARDSGRPMGQLLLERHRLREHQLGIAIEVALTGHLMLSSLTPTAPRPLPRA